ncbi:hypothetical protein [Paraburkholderia sp. EG304]|uniref:hypothetical protein n=1 Tax=Paraburkholderia sp. EG304 TaxID=3237015 RepID=UPI003977E7EE
MKTTERKPKWAKWRLIPEVEVWQAIALSLDIEPDKVTLNRQAWMGARHPFAESEEFVDRLDVTCANILNTSHFPSGGALVMGKRYSCGVRLAEFARFASEVAQWDVPDELRALAGNSSPAAQPESVSPSASAHATAGNQSGAALAAKSWQEQAREIADEFFARDTAAKCRDSLDGYSKRVMAEMQRRQIHGPRGRIDNHQTIKRDALQGDNWWAKQTK